MPLKKVRDLGVIGLPVRQRILYKVAVTAFDCVRGTGPAYFRDDCVPVADISGGHTSVRLNAVACWFLGPGPGSANGASMLQPPSSGTRCLHTCAQPSSVLNSSHRPTHSSENFLFKSVYVYTTLTLTLEMSALEFTIILC